MVTVTVRLTQAELTFVTGVTKNSLRIAHLNLDHMRRSHSEMAAEYQTYIDLYEPLLAKLEGANNDSNSASKVHMRDGSGTDGADTGASG